MAAVVATARLCSSTFVTALHKQQTQFRERERKKKNPAAVNPLQRIMSVCLPVCRSASMC